MNLYMLNRQVNAMAANEKRTCSEQIRMCALLQDAEALQCRIDFDQTNQVYLIERTLSPNTEIKPVEYCFSALFEIYRKDLVKCKSIEDIVLFMRSVFDSNLIDYEKEYLKYLANDFYLGISAEKG